AGPSRAQAESRPAATPAVPRRRLRARRRWAARTRAARNPFAKHSLRARTGEATRPAYDRRMPAHPSTRRKPLSGQVVIVTRPDAAGLLRRARAPGAEALPLPGLALRAGAFPRPAARDAWAS